jgi:DNA mismatch endonuclease (patch repair protein)
MRANRGTQNELEKRMRRLLRQSGISGYRLNDRSLPGKPDFAFRAERVAVFVHGCWWHRHSCREWPEVKTHREYWNAKWSRNAARDMAKPAKLEDLGWVVVTIWECELGADPGACVTRVRWALGPQS